MKIPEIIRYFFYLDFSLITKTFQLTEKQTYESALNCPLSERMLMREYFHDNNTRW